MNTTMNSTPTPHRRLGRDLIIAGAMLAIALALAFLMPDRMRAQRILGVVMGLFVVFYANEVPKRIPSVNRCDPMTAQARRRFIGWTLVLGGLGYAVAWMIAPIRIAPLLAIFLLATALAVVFARITWDRPKGTPS